MSKKEASGVAAMATPSAIPVRASSSEAWPPSNRSTHRSITTGLAHVAAVKRFGERTTVDRPRPSTTHANEPAAMPQPRTIAPRVAKAASPVAALPLTTMKNAAASTADRAISKAAMRRPCLRVMEGVAAAAESTRSRSGTAVFIGFLVWIVSNASARQFVFPIDGDTHRLADVEASELHRVLGDAERQRRLGGAEALPVNEIPGGALRLGHPVQDLLHRVQHLPGYGHLGGVRRSIDPQVHRLRVFVGRAREEFLARAPVRVDEHVAPDRERPGNDVGPRRIVSARGVHLEQRLLREVLGEGAIARLAAEESEQARSQQIVDVGEGLLVTVG